MKSVAFVLEVAGSIPDDRRPTKIPFYCASNVFSVTEFEFEGSSRRRKFEKWKKFKVVLAIIIMYRFLPIRTRSSIWNSNLRMLLYLEQATIRVVVVNGIQD